MLISPPEIHRSEDHVTVSARVQVDTCPVELPETLWFRFPAAYADYVSDSCNAFAVAMLPLAMHLGEDLHVEGHLSPRLLQGLREYVRVQITWQPSPFQEMHITAQELRPSEMPGEPAVATSFSGGVDSLYTLQCHSGLHEKNPYYRLTHALLINGFDADTDLEPGSGFGRISRAQQAVMQRAGTELVVCSTNCMAFSDMYILKQSFGAIVTTPALALGGLFSAFYLPSSFLFSDFLRDGSHPMLDHLVSTESMEVMHDASDVGRAQKVQRILQWPEVRTALRVCFFRAESDEQSGALINCCRCEKCIRTMIALELAGELEDFAAFPRPLTHFSIITCLYDSPFARQFARELLGQTFRARRWGLFADLALAQMVTLAAYLPRQLHRFAEKHWPAYERFMRRHFRLAPRPMRRIGKAT